MRAAAELGREIADLHHAHAVAILLAEQRHGAGRQRRIEIHLGIGHRRVGLHVLVDQLLHLLDLAVLHLRAVREVEAQVIGRDQRARLRDVRAEDAPQRRVQQMRARVMLPQSLPPRRVDRDGDLLVLAEATGGDLHAVHNELAAAVERVDDIAAARAADERAAVADLSARLGVPRRAIEDDFDLVAGRGLPHPAVVGHHGEDRRRRSQRLVADELLRPREAAADLLVERDRVGRALVGAEAGLRAGALALRLHLALPGRVGVVGHAPALVDENLFREIAREAERVVEREQEATVDRPPAPRALRLRVLLDAAHALIQRARELLLFLPHRLDDPSALADDLGICAAHDVGNPVDAAPEERLGQAELAAVSHRAAHDASQDVASPLIGRQDAVGDQERRGTHVIDDDLHRDVAVGVGAVPLAAQLGDAPDQRREQVGLVRRELLLHDRGHALEPHAGVDRRPRQRRHFSAGVTVELHEDEVPDLQPAIALARRSQTRAARRLFGTRRVVALMEVDLRARATGPRIAHGPEVVLFAEAQDSILRQSRHRLPEVERLVVVPEHCGLQPAPIEAQVPGEELPRELDRVGLEVVAE